MKIRSLLAILGLANSFALPVFAQQTNSPDVGEIHLNFRKVINIFDPTFNQLLGINDEGVIAGYFGSGAAGHPNKGYVLLPPYGQGNYVNQNLQNSVQTQVTGLNNRGVTVGFFSDTNKGVGMDANTGWVRVNGHFRLVNFPTE